MRDRASRPSEGAEVAARLIANMLAASADDSPAVIALKTSIDLGRVEEILRERDYPDLYEIAAFERAYSRRLWPGPVE